MDRKKKVCCLLIVPLIMMAFTLASPCGAETHEVTNIEIYSELIGASAYNYCFALGDLINKHSKWLRTTTIEMRGSTTRARFLSENPDKRKKAIAHVSLFTLTAANRGRKPFKAPYKSLKGLTLHAHMPTTIAVLDPKIKKASDLKGKNIAIGPSTDGRGVIPSMILKTWGLEDKAKISHWSGFGEQNDWLLSGTADAGILCVTELIPGEKCAFAPSIKELTVARDVYLLDVTPEVIDETSKRENWPIAKGVVPAGAVGSQQKRPVGGWAYNCGIYCDAELPEDVAYEIARIAYEHADDFKKYYSAGVSVTRDTIFALPLKSDQFHPGAMKFIREKAAKYGR